ncbi:MAG: tyrosine--tRNA ligase [Firmicutes bacterium HGW-Firmicutes-20]|jgi:tyrosyl-tRNA synthetase|nr:MAG: tyrosine--tRNA ligase [Firmicutes bacterium HGW-Firmicutes-20]PKM88882.1 MAG: tyrosine--tRNA ligase [Firmicutes bacterium HGW-Firmicutes-10]
MDFLDELTWRGLIKDVTDLEGLKERIKTPMTVYCGFDPTADSLHIGHLQQILLLKRYQQQGHHPIALIGGATGMIGDPRPTTERSLQTLDEINQNIVGISAQIRSILCNTDLPVTIVNNYDWLSKIDILTFLRDFGKHFNVNYMIAKDIVSSRLATGISFTEFTYTILQAADWLHLYQNHQCEMQIGGSDQWGNLTSGSELIRKVVGNQAKVFGVTSPLITNSDGSKFGKSEGKNIWLDPQKTDSYQFYQYWINVSDNDIIDFMKRLSFKTVDEIMSLSLAMETQAHLRLPQKALAEELTELVFGKEGLISALKITEVLFSGQFDQLSLSELEVALAEASFGEVWEDTLLIDCLVLVGAAKSKREARDLITGGSVLVNGNKMADLEFIVQKENALHKSLTVIRKGKKYYFVIRHI